MFTIEMSFGNPGPRTIYFNLNQNTCHLERSGIVKFKKAKTEEVILVVPINQESVDGPYPVSTPAPTPVPTPTPTPVPTPVPVQNPVVVSRSYTRMGGSDSIYVPINCNWKATANASNSSVITLNKTSGNGGSYIHWRISANNYGSPRYGAIVFTNTDTGRIVYVIDITQSGR